MPWRTPGAQLLLLDDYKITVFAEKSYTGHPGSHSIRVHSLDLTAVIYLFNSRPTSLSVTWTFIFSKAFLSSVASTLPGRTIKDRQSVSVYIWLAFEENTKIIETEKTEKSVIQFVIPLPSWSMDLNTIHSFFWWSVTYLTNSSNDMCPSRFWSPSVIICYKGEAHHKSYFRMHLLYYYFLLETFSITHYHYKQQSLVQWKYCLVSPGGQTRVKRGPQQNNNVLLDLHNSSNHISLIQ